VYIYITAGQMKTSSAQNSFLGLGTLGTCWNIWIPGEYPSPVPRLFRLGGTSIVHFLPLCTTHWPPQGNLEVSRTKKSDPSKISRLTKKKFIMVFISKNTKHLSTS
jgi:hypothetical protein